MLENVFLYAWKLKENRSHMNIENIKMQGLRIYWLEVKVDSSDQVFSL